MPRMPYFHCFPDEFLVGLQGLNDELTAAYVRILLKLYATKGKLKNDPEALRHLLGKRDRRPTVRIVQKLIALDKLSIDADGFIRNGRVLTELAKFEPTSDRDPSEKGGGTRPERGRNANGSAAKNREETTRAHTPARPLVPESRTISEKPSSLSYGSKPTRSFQGMLIAEALKARKDRLDNDPEPAADHHREIQASDTGTGAPGARSPGRSADDDATD